MAHTTGAAAVQMSRIDVALNEINQIVRGYKNARRPLAWGEVGDLTHLADLLTEAANFLNPDEEVAA